MPTPFLSLEVRAPVEERDKVGWDDWQTNAGEMNVQDSHQHTHLSARYLRNLFSKYLIVSNLFLFISGLPYQNTGSYTWVSVDLFLWGCVPGARILPRRYSGNISRMNCFHNQCDE